MPESFGELVRERRRMLDLTQERLAELVGCATVTIKRVEHNHLRPSRQIAERLAFALEISDAEHEAFVRLARTGAASPPPLALVTPPVTPLLVGHTLRGYELRERIAAGGFGEVYRALQPTIGREVAIKVILPQFAGQAAFIRRFESEARLIAQLEHPQIVPLYDYWRDASGAFLVMRLMRGGSLQSRLGSRWSLDAALRLADELGAALLVAHRRGIVHCDVKPANILLDEEGRAYLADFGIGQGGRDAVNRLTQGASSDYLSPEQMRGDSPAPAADLYSLAVVLYELLAGERLYSNIGPDERVARRLSQPLPALHPLRSDVPPAFDAVLARASSPLMAERFHDATEFVTDLLRAARRTSQHAGAMTVPSVIGSNITDATLTATTARTVENPYRGLHAFQVGDAERFFGREVLTRRLVERLSERRSARFLAVVGPSGSGKSSVVRAGLIPAVQRGAIPGSEHWFVALATPGARPLDEIEAALLRVAVNPPASLQDQLRADEHGLARAIRRCLPSDESVELLLVIDQLEELWTLTEDDAERAHVLTSLASAVADSRSRLRLVVTLRADFFDRPLREPALAELMRQRTEVVTPLREAELERAIAMPAAGVGVSMEPALIRQLVRDVTAQPGALPLLQYALTELFDRSILLRPSGVAAMLNIHRYREIGGMRGALTRRAEEAFATLGEREQELARVVLLRLVQPGEEGEDTRCRVRRSELPSEAESLLNALGSARLLTFDREPHSGEPTVEVAHEALISAWGRLRSWLDEGRAELRLHRRLAFATAEWEATNRDPSFLASGSRLAQFEELMDSALLIERERAFVQASLAERNRAADEERKRQEELRSSLARSEALRLAAEARRLLLGCGQSELIALLALRSLHIYPTPEGDEALTDAALLELPVLRIPWSGYRVAITPDGRSALIGSSPARLYDIQNGTLLCELPASSLQMFCAELSQDGRIGLTCGDAHIAELWNLADGCKLREIDFTCYTTNEFAGTASLSPDGRLVATSCDNGDVQLWDATNGRELQRLEGHSDVVFSYSFSQDSTQLLTGSFDHSVRLWDLETRRELQCFVGHGEIIAHVSLTADGCQALTSGFDNMARLWDTRSGRELQRYVGHTEAVKCAALFANGSRVATSSDDGTARIWDAASGAELQRFIGHSGFVFGLGITPDERRLLTTSGDGSTCIWELVTDRPPRVLQAHSSSTRIALTPDGTTILSVSAGGEACLWERATGRLLLRLADHTGPIDACAISFDGRLVLTGAMDHIARLWDLSSGALLHELGDHSLGIQAATFFNRSKRAITASLDGTARVWDTETGTCLYTLTGHAAQIFDVCISPDDRLIATGSIDRRTCVWDAHDGQLVLTIPIGSPSVAFTADSASLVTGSWGGPINRWCLGDGTLECEYSGHIQSVWSVGCYADRLLSASADGTARLWDIKSGTELRRVGGGSGMRNARLTPDGAIVVSGHADGSVHMWDADVSVTIADLEGRLRRGFSDEERLRFGEEVLY